MSYGQWNNVTQAVLDALVDGNGSLRTVPTGRFSNNLVENLQEAELRRRGISSDAPLHVRITGIKKHPASAPINSNIILRQFSLIITVSRTIAFGEQIDPAQRQIVEVLANEDSDAISQVLETAPNLETTALGLATNIAGDAVRYIGSTIRIVSTSKDEPNRLETIHTFDGVLKVFPAGASTLLMETGDHLLQEDGSFILV